MLNFINLLGCFSDILSVYFGVKIYHKFMLENIDFMPFGIKISIDL